MKTGRYQRRFYRDWVYSKDLYLARVRIQETDLQVLTDKPLDKEFVQERIFLYRRQIEDYISKDPRFLSALKPIEVELNAGLIVRKMSEAAKLADVGPMAAVAGAIVQFLGRDLLRKGYRQVIIENGGDIFLKTLRTLKIGIYAGRSRRWNGLGLKISPRDTPLGICSSSGTVGHSLSFGCADSVVVISRNASLADAAATAVANRVSSKPDLNRALNFGRSIKGVLGVVIILKDSLASWGKVEFLA